MELNPSPKFDIVTDWNYFFLPLNLAVTFGEPKTLLVEPLGLYATFAAYVFFVPLELLYPVNVVLPQELHPIKYVLLFL
jgi:hypothetical protein